MEKAFIETLKNISDKYQLSLDNNHRKYNGVYYTGFDLATKIVEELFETQQKKNIWELRFLEPAVGIGNFVFAYLLYISRNYKLTKDQIEELYSNIFVCENDKYALNIFEELFRKSSKYLFNTNLSVNFKANIGGAIIYNLQKEPTYQPIEQFFNDIKFDVIVTNPPYKSLRAERKHYKSKDEYYLDKEKYQLIKKDAKQRYRFSEPTNANIYNYFVEEILIHYSSNESLIALLIPASILTDKSCVKIREHFINQKYLMKITGLNENNDFIDANQALSYLLIDKSKNNNETIRVSRMENNKETFSFVDIKDINKRSNKEIVLLNDNEAKLLSKMESLPKVKDLDFIEVLRGELDITINRSSITRERTPYPLLRGRNIGYYQLDSLDSTDFALVEFVNDSSKGKYIHKCRIACQQISNMNKKKRLVFAEVKDGYVLANSCNFITVNKNEYDITQDYLMGLFNSDLYDWYFKLFSSNNHINNYELDNLPVPINSIEFIKSITTLSRKMSEESSNIIKEEIDRTISNFFNDISEKSIIKDNSKEDSVKIDFDGFEIDLKKAIQEKNKMISAGKPLNLFNYKLSDLDMEIIRSIPEGGNWRDIPQETINKSKRLLKIQETGGRTTLYGRLEYFKPSYTITTYFSRPGNGCNIHPRKDRVLSTREAARLQSFPDDYYFFGNQREVLNQIGNAVPPLIGYLFGEGLNKQLNVTRSVDLFSGAGGLTYGMKKAGITPIVANDIDRSAILTLKINNPEIEVIFDDLTKVSVKEKIIRMGKQENADVISGGPPCQGFSLAGFRKLDDSRNQLFRDFLEVVEGIKPKAFIFENVVGLLSFNKGKTFLEIKQLFKKVGYNVHAEKLNFVYYGVPQRRIRVILVGIRTDLNINPILIFPNKYTENKEQQITVFDAISDLDKKINSTVENPIYQKLLKKEITVKEYYNFLKSKKGNPAYQDQLSFYDIYTLF